MKKKICNDKTGDDKKFHVFCEFIIATIVGSLMSLPSAWIAAGIAYTVALAFGIYRAQNEACKTRDVGWR